MNIHSFPNRAIHLDFHTMPGVHDVGRDFRADEFARTLKTAGVEYITVFARCNLGFAYYPTKIGVRYPGLRVDLLGQMVKACHQQKIQAVAYFNAGLDHEHALRHREWCKMDRNGVVHDHKEMGHFFRKLCLNTGYRPHLLAMVKEVLDRYPVDGIFLDCFHLTPCYGVECLDGMKRAGLNPLDDQHAQEFCWRVTDRFREDVNRLVKARRPGIKICFNGLPYGWQPKHIELEVLPTGGWGYDSLPWQIRYARTLGKPYFTMTGRFHGGWGDFGGLRPAHSLLFDLYYSIANGGTCSVGDHLHPRGRLEPAVYGLIGRVYDQVRQLEPWTSGATPVTEIAVLNPRLRRCPGDQAIDFSGIAGATRMLSELKHQFDLGDGDGDLAGYRVIVLPDDVVVDAGLKRKLQQHLRRGGILISSGAAGLNPGRTGFALPEYRIAYAGPEPHDPTFFVPAREVARDLPEMPLTIYTPGVVLRAKRGARVLARLHRSYFQKASWDRYHEHLYTPPDRDLNRPALVRCGNVFHFSFPIFTAYFADAVVAYKHLLRNCLDRVLPEPLVKAPGLPSFGQVTVTRAGPRRLVHVLTYVPELRGKKTQMIEEPIAVRHVEVSLRTDGWRPRRVYLAPTREPLEFRVHENYLTTVIPEVNGYQLVVFER